MLKTIIAAAIAVSIAIPAAAQNATITKTAVGCPTVAGLDAAYKVGSAPGAKGFTDVVAAYDCEYLAKGRNLTLVSTKADVALVVVPRKNKRVYVPAHSVAAHH